MRDILSDYGDDACSAATVSRQLPRTNKPVDVTVSLFRTGVQFPPSPSSKNANFDTKLAFLLFARKALFYGLFQPYCFSNRVFKPSRNHFVAAFLHFSRKMNWKSKSNRLLLEYSFEDRKTANKKHIAPCSEVQCAFTLYSLNQSGVAFACLSRNSTLRTIPAVRESANEAHRLPKRTVPK